MNPIFPELPHTLGVYTLTRLIELRNNTALYEAQQTHVDRSVVLEVLQPGVSHTEEVAFLAQSRMRVSSNHIPHVADVFESLRAEGIWFLTQELPQGRSLSDIAAAGETLEVYNICKVVTAAARMYSQCLEANISVLPLAPSSIFVENNGDVHFLSPLVEGIPSNRPRQMRALAAALWAVCPQKKAQGLGRAMTLLQWLNEGLEGTYLQWPELEETAETIISQLRIAPEIDTSKPFFTRIKERILKSRLVQTAFPFLKRWGTHIAAAMGIIILMSSMGTMFGMGNPETTGGSGNSGILCCQESKNELVMRYPVTVQEYADFMIAFEELDDDERDQLTEGIPVPCKNLEPQNWEAQWKRGDIEAAVTGVTYWQALLYARSKGGDLPTVNQIQTVLAIGAGHSELEWSRTVKESPIPGIYNGTCYLLTDGKGMPVPVNDRAWSDSRCGFRITLPDNND